MQLEYVMQRTVKYNLQRSLVYPAACFVCYFSIGFPVSIRFRVVEGCLQKSKARCTFFVIFLSANAPSSVHGQSSLATSFRKKKQPVGWKGLK